MLPKSGCTWERISVARSRTLAISGRPSQIWTPSIAVGIAGNVLITSATASPGSNGLYFLGSNVSGAAMPPAIQSTMIASAFAAG